MSRSSANLQFAVCSHIRRVTDRHAVQAGLSDVHLVRAGKEYFKSHDMITYCKVGHLLASLGCVSLAGGPPLWLTAAQAEG